MSWWQAALLGLVQGLAEFLPISSSGHLVLGEYLLGLNAEAANDVTFEVFVHFGTALSILVVYRKRIWRILRDAFGALATPSVWAESLRPGRIERARGEFQAARLGEEDADSVSTLRHGGTPIRMARSLGRGA